MAEIGGVEGFDPDGLERARAVLEEHVASRTTPGAVGLVLRRGGVAACWAVGRHTYDPEASSVRADDIYDLASLTKVVSTTTVCMALVGEGRLELDGSVSSYLPAFRDGDRDRVTVRHLLAHCGGFPAHLPLYRTCRSKAEVLDAVCRTSPDYVPGTATVYSDLGFIVLGALLERMTGRPLEELVSTFVIAPLGMGSTMYCPAAALCSRVPPTEVDSVWRGRLVHGEVHDENAAAMAGVAPHAGLFGTAGDLGRFLRVMLGRGRLEGRRIYLGDCVRLFTRRAGLVSGSTRALGWDTPSTAGSTAGSHLSGESFGHTGFTGTSLWADPVRDLGVVLLTNRVHPTRENQGIRRLRPAFHDAVAQALIE